MRACVTSPVVSTPSPHLKEQALSRKRYSLSKRLAVAAGVVRNACVRPLKYIGTMHGNDARAWFLTIVRHGFYDLCKRNRPPGIAREDAAIGVAIDEDGLPACRAVPWLAIPRGLGHPVRANPDLAQILRLPNDHAGGRRSVERLRSAPGVSQDRGRMQLASPDQGIKPAHLGYCIDRTGQSGPPIVGIDANQRRRYGSSRI